MKDTIVINSLLIPLHIGVTEEERKEPQTIKMHLDLVTDKGFSDLEDTIEKTVNYYDVSVRVKQVAAEYPRKLIETLAEDVSAMILKEFEVAELQLEIEKFILADTAHVGLRMRRTKC